MRYEDAIATGQLRPDEAQRQVALRFGKAVADLEAQEARPSLLARLARRKPDPVRGVYLWGGVGRGKSMLMDLFFDCVGIAEKRRVHFHEFMQEVHDRLRIERSKETGDPILPVADAIAAEARLIAFDEMIVTNSADAMILSRLFTRIIAQGVTVVATSNRPPQDLYKNGLNREHFLPFIALLKDRLDVLTLDGPTDYRMQRLGGFQTWHVPNGDAATEALSRAFFRLTDFPVEDRDHVPSETLAIKGGRELFVPKSLKGVAVFSFKRLCGEPRGIPDYLALAHRYHTVILVGIPVLDGNRKSEAARFKTLIDTLYEHGVKLLASADRDPDALYCATDDAFEFERTISRLNEMGSQDYLARGHGLSDEIAAAQLQSPSPAQSAVT
ncbi:cell division protein ZapE [Sphingopyxis granuli]|uniref:cell division protein ZapE n=1 Tax=Sphingopyxis granuli TaxID=267128 RepID=UPI001F53A324|nr:cell division protein ZapE [Sphingopyxis granuli]UNK79605.1 cell division protein ZapE [Sphingopyxis granuli]